MYIFDVITTINLVNIHHHTVILYFRHNFYIMKSIEIPGKFFIFQKFQFSFSKANVRHSKSKSCPSNVTLQHDVQEAIV